MRYIDRGKDKNGCRVTFQPAAIKTKCGCMLSSVMGGLNCMYSSSTNPWIANPALNRNTGSLNNLATRIGLNRKPGLPRQGEQNDLFLQRKQTLDGHFTVRQDPPSVCRDSCRDSSGNGTAHGFCSERQLARLYQPNRYHGVASPDPRSRS